MMHNLIPSALHAGDKVAIAATARKISPAEIEPTVRLLQEWGLEVIVPEGLFEEYGQLAGTDDHRANLMQHLLDDDEVRAIFCARGGYGTVRMIDHLDWTRFQTSPKWIVGYSDVTVLHSHIHNLLGISTLHATMPINITWDDVATWQKNTALASLHQFLFVGSLKLSLEAETTYRNCNQIHLEGEIVGGNLSILYSLSGTPSDIDTRDKILLIEDLDEYLYHVDRMMLNLKRSGKLRDIKALIVGAMSDMHDNSTPFGMDVREIILDAVRDYRHPVIFTNDIGHVGLQNAAIPLGHPCSIHSDNTKNIVLEFTQF